MLLKTQMRRNQHIQFFYGAPLPVVSGCKVDSIKKILNVRIYNLTLRMSGGRQLKKKTHKMLPQSKVLSPDWVGEKPKWGLW